MAFLAALGASFVVAYLPMYLKLAGGAWASEQEGHGPIIMVMAAWAAWQQRHRLQSVELVAAPVAGWAILLISLLIMAITRSQDLLMVEVASQIPVCWGAFCSLAGGRWPGFSPFRWPSWCFQCLRRAGCSMRSPCR